MFSEAIGLPAILLFHVEEGSSWEHSRTLATVLALLLQEQVVQSVASRV